MPWANRTLSHERQQIPNRLKASLGILRNFPLDQLRREELVRRSNQLNIKRSNHNSHQIIEAIVFPYGLATRRLENRSTLIGETEDAFTVLNSLFSVELDRSSMAKTIDSPDR